MAAARRGPRGRRRRMRGGGHAAATIVGIFGATDCHGNVTLMLVAAAGCPLAAAEHASAQTVYVLSVRC